LQIKWTEAYTVAASIALFFICFARAYTAFSNRKDLEEVGDRCNRAQFISATAILVKGKNFSFIVIPADAGISLIYRPLGDACIHRHDMKN
jgi:hypothetical protein